MNKFIAWLVLLIGLGCAINFSSCKKPLSFSKENLTFSQDTVVFDTIFSTIASVTKRFKIYNPSNKTLQISQVELVGGANSPFRINFDGVAGTNFADIEINGNDSLFVFVEVTLDQNNTNNPLIFEDRVRFQSNGQDQFVELAAWGQDAYFHYSYISQGIFDLNEGIWPNDKPHVIYGAAIVDSAKSLTIQAGTDIFLHNNAFLFNYKGTLNIEGTLGNEVTLQGDRLEASYDDTPGQYYGIYMVEAQPSSINYAIIKNATSGIQVNGAFQDNPPSTPTLAVSNTIINNSASYGIFLYNGDLEFNLAGTIKAENCVLSKNGVHSLIMLGGGGVNFNHCHLLGYGTGENVSAAVGLSNHYGGTGLVRGISEATFTNNVIYGNSDIELAIDTIPNVAITLNFNFENNLIQSSTVFTSPIFHPTSNIWNEDPAFTNIEENDYHFSSASPLRDAGSSLFPTTNLVDIEGDSQFTPDIGAYEF